MVMPQLLTPLTTQMKMTKKKISRQSDIKIITEVITTEVEIITTEEIEVELRIPTQTPTEDSNKPRNTEVTQVGEEIQTGAIEEATLKEVILNNTHRLKTTWPISKVRNQCANTAKSLDTQLRTAGLFKPKTKPEE